KRGFVPLLHIPIKHACEAVGSVIGRMAGTHKLKEAMETRMRALGVQLEETRRELEEAERRRVTEMEWKVEVEIRQNEGDQKKAWE
ncbi:unnamed protein product, partial [Closterium sp. Naga37s-1]